MKQIIIMCIIALTSIQFVNAQKKTYDEISVQVDGLGCPFCAYGLEKKFKELKGIKKVKIAIETGLMTFKYPAEKALSMQKVSSQVDKAGYTPIVVNITRSNGKKEEMKPGGNSYLVKGKTETRSFFVNGKCDMCKARIERTANSIKGVKSAYWNLKTKQLKVTYSPKITRTKAIMSAIAKKGHDTQNVKATDQAYAQLPPCCNYKRK